MTERSERTYFDYETIRAHVRSAYGVLTTLNLFRELADSRVKFPPPFSIKEWRKRYIEIADPTEYETAMVLIGNWEHWQALRGHQVIRELFDEWMQEVEIKLRSQGVRNLISVAGSTSPGSAGAAKWLAEGGFVHDERLRSKAGREKEERVLEDIRKRTADDAARLNLKPKKET